MRLLMRRAAALVFVAVLVTFGMIVFMVRYFTEAPYWAQQYSNAHLYKNGQIAASGTIYDRNGAILFEVKNGTARYNEDKSVRTALMHAIGDGKGDVSTGAQVVFKDKLMGWNILNGAYRFNDWLPHSSSDLTLTLDAKLCDVAYSALNGRKGTVGVYNYKTGEILCMVSSPSFDPEDPPDIAKQAKKYEGVYMNRLLSGTYTPGSVFKLLTVAAALEKVPGIENQTFHCTGREKFGGQEVTCPSVHGDVTFEEALARSCNISFAKISLEVGSKNLQDYADKLGFNSALSVDGIRTAKGRVDVKDAKGGDLAWAGIGQYSDTVNPLNFMAYMGAIANSGVRVNPTLDRKSENKLASLFPDIEKKQDRILPEETALKIKQLMRNDVISEYGENNYKSLELCAKTGTAEVGGNAAPHSWFAGFLDREDYPLAFVVVVENGGSGISAAGSVAAKVLKAAVENE